MSKIFKFNHILNEKAPTKQQVVIVHMLPSNDANKSLNKKLEKKLVLEEPVQQKA